MIPYFMIFVHLIRQLMYYDFQFLFHIFPYLFQIDLFFFQYYFHNLPIIIESIVLF